MSAPFARVCVACRGEIAVRVVRACRELGARAIVAHTPDDARSLAVREADEAVEVGSYLDPDALAEAARASGCGALHPGYGFLAEDPRLAEACAARGVVFVGPPPDALRALARKDEARRIAQAVGVDVLPGGSDPTIIGYPLLVKAAAGGGGRGMRVVNDASALDEAIDAAGREAQAAFGDGTLLFERYLERPRHVEIQFLRDAHGAAVHLGERDCSIQRRHQKVLEESPAPGIGRDDRTRLGAAALRLAEAVGYAGAGTAEFLRDEDGGFWFLEINARIQVEHPVSEAVTAVDLVRRQLEIAAGWPLDLAQHDLVLRGHAVEARVCAEDPDHGFLPAAGHLLDVRWPVGPGIRVDAGYATGDDVGIRYDSLLAKVIAHAETRERALARLATALDEAVVLGVTTNLPFLRWLVRHPAVVAGDISTGFIEEHFTPAPDESLPDDALEAANRFAAAETADDPWRGRWRAAAVRTPPALAVARDDDGSLYVWHDGRSLRVPRTTLAGVAELARRPAGGGDAEHARLTAPMPGTVLRIEVAEGDEVAAHQTLLVLEAMKMEQPVAAPFDGRVERLAYQVGATVRTGDVLVELTSA